jgi:hypothetical protein
MLKITYDLQHKLIGYRTTFDKEAPSNRSG